MLETSGSTRRSELAGSLRSAARPALSALHRAFFLGYAEAVEQGAFHGSRSLLGKRLVESLTADEVGVAEDLSFAYGLAQRAQFLEPSGDLGPAGLRQRRLSEPERLVGDECGDGFSWPDGAVGL